MHAVDHGVQLLQERHRLEVLVAAVDVRRPLAVLPGVVEVEHRGHRVDPQAVDVELAQPVEGVGDEEVAHLGAAVVEHEGAPVGVLAALGVGVLVERAAVEAGQRAGVAGEVGRHPVDDHADPALVEVIDEPAEVVGVAEAGGRRVEPRDLVAPRRLVGVLGHRHQLHVGEPELAHVIGEQRGQLAVGQEARRRRGDATTRGAPRRALSRSRTGSTSVASGHPLVVAPLVLALRRRRWPSRRSARRTGPSDRLRWEVVPVGADDLVLVGGAGPDAAPRTRPTRQRPSRCSGWSWPLQSFHGPATATWRALGAQTAKVVPSTSPMRVGWAPSTSQSRS